MPQAARWAGTPSIRGRTESMRMALLTFSLVGLQCVFSNSICERGAADLTESLLCIGLPGELKRHVRLPSFFLSFFWWPANIDRRLHTLPPPTRTHQIAHLAGLDRRPTIRVDHPAPDRGDYGSIAVEMGSSSTVYDRRFAGGGGVFVGFGVDNRDCWGFC